MLPALKVTHLARIESDHSPLLVQLDDISEYKSHFIFQQMWTDHEDFLKVVEAIWATPVLGSPSFRVATTSSLKFKLKAWNWETFEDVKKKISQLHVDISDGEAELQLQWSSETDLELQKKKHELHQALGWESELLLQQTRMHCNSESGINSKFFHVLIRGRRARNKISLHCVNDSIIKDPKIIAEMAAKHFGELFTASNYYLSDDLFMEYPRQVTDEMNTCLSQIPTELEIWEVVCSISVGSTPGEDGFTGYFLKHAGELSKRIWWRWS